MVVITLRVLALYGSYLAALNKNFIYACPCVNDVRIFLPGFRVSVLLSCSAIFLLFEIWKKPAKNCPIFFIGIDLIGPDPTSNRNKAENNSQVARFANLSEDQLPQILAERYSLGTKKVTNWSLTTFKGKISVFVVVFKFVQPGE